ncbi:MAG: hypothetical protein EAX86_03525 [Candidatus Heimdallarchaeota archaeon]|nr:hypothetical protein [Candidatus Heimdallarchaeota archaeon]
MPLLCVKIYNKNYDEIQSTVNPPPISLSKQFLFHLGQISNGNLSYVVQAILNHDQIFAFTSKNEYFILAIATNNTPYDKLRQFLLLLSDALTSDILLPCQESYQMFQDLCDSSIKTVDSAPELTVALLGLERSGKTTFANYFSNRSLAAFDTYSPTHLLNIIRINQHMRIPALKLFDLGMNFKSQWWKFRKESDAFIFFVDSADVRMNESRDLFNEIRSFWDLPYVIAANKRDTSKIVNIRKYLSRKFCVPIRNIFEIETYTGTGVYSLLAELITRIQDQDVTLSLIGKIPKQGRGL